MINSKRKEKRGGILITARENLMGMLRREGYMWPPLEFSLCPSLEERFKKEIGGPGSNYMEYFGMPWRRVGDLVPDNQDKSRFLSYYGQLGENVEIDEWGVGHGSSPNSMHMTKMLYPLEHAETVEDIKTYPIPVYTQKNNGWVKDKVIELQKHGLAAIGNMQCTVWETAWYLRGMENLMMDMLSDAEMADAVFEMVEKMSTDRALLYAKAGVDILYLGDDIGMQHSIMMSEELYTEWILPRLKRIISKVKKVRPDILVFYHSCGFIVPFIKHLIDAGVDVLNPIQSECMEFEEIYRAYGDRISFHGTIGTQTVMPFGTPEEIKENVRKNLDIVGPKGGLFVAPTHLLEPEVPWENILAYVEACRNYNVK